MHNAAGCVGGKEGCIDGDGDGGASDGGDQATQGIDLAHADHGRNLNRLTDDQRMGADCDDGGSGLGDAGDGVGLVSDEGNAAGGGDD